MLLLEDSRFDAELVQSAMKKMYPAAAIRWVGNEADFVAGLQESGLDLILSDYELQGFTGVGALAHARRLAPEIPFIFVSGVIGEDNAVELLKQGATDYVSKGRLTRLPPVIGRALAEARERQARQFAERQAREANAVFARLVDALQDYAVILLDPQGTILSWNRAAAQVFGHGAAQAIGSNGRMLFLPEDRAAGVFEARLHSALARGKAEEACWMLRRDGSQLWAEGTVVPLTDDAGQHSGFCAVVHDGTEAHRAAEQLRHAKEEAERANSAKDRFIAVLSHELRTPLAPIASAIHVLQQSAKVPEHHRHLLPMIARNVMLESRLIEDLLDLTALSSGKLVLRQEPLDGHRIVLEVTEMLTQQLQEKRLQLQMELRAANTRVSADPARLQQVVWNLLRNAVKFTPEGGRIVIRTSSDAGSFEMCCSDTGIGIEPAMLGRIFEPFEQAGSSIARRFGGLGLGLAIARGLVQEHGGTLEAASDGSGRGANFTLRLPLALSAGAEPATARAAIDSTAIGGRLLLVEDNDDSGEALSLVLQHYGHVVVRASSCAEAREAARRQSFDLVITDIGLPDGSGLSLPAALKLPCVAVSGFGEVQDQLASTEHGFVAHLVKPVDIDTLRRVVEDCLSSRRTQTMPAPTASPDAPSAAARPPG